jgi:hypothetical protein
VSALPAARQRAKQEPLDWDAVRRLAHHERLSPLLYRILHEQGVAPVSVERALRDEYYRTLGCNAFLLDQLGDALHHLKAHNVAVIVLKGAALAETVYRDLGLRPMGDLDLLVRREALSTTLCVMGTLGFDRLDPEVHEGIDAAYENEITLSKPANLEVQVGVHWSLFDSPLYQHKLPMDWFWQTARPARLCDVPGQMLGPEAQVLHLCGHLWLHHQGQGLLWLHDVAEVIAFYRTQIDWEQLLDKAQTFDLVVPVQQTLTHLADEWHVPIPADVLQRLRGLQPSPHELRTFSWLTAEHRPVAWRFRSDLVSMRDWKERWRFAWSHLCPSPAYMQHRYRIRHACLLPLYYPYRWFLGLSSAVSPIAPRLSHLAPRLSRLARRLSHVAYRALRIAHHRDPR